MRHAAEFGFFLVVATVFHLVLFQIDGTGASSSAGDRGDETLTLVASSETLSAMVRQWNRPVDALQHIAIPQQVETVAPQTHAVSPPQRAEPVQKQILPDFENGPSRISDLPVIDTTVPPPRTVATAASARPRMRPPTPRKDAKTAPLRQAQSVPRQAAAGSGRRNASGVKAATKTPAKRQAQNPALMAQWGNNIRAAVERRKRYPSNTRARGKVVLTVAVSSSGALSSVKVRRSSGHTALDQAAITAVRRTRFKAAPKGLKAGVHHFSLPISFAP